MLEAHFIMPVVMKSDKMLQGDWRKVMAEDLLMPTLKISKFMAYLRRFRRNYLYIYVLIAAAWCTKIWIHYPDSHTWKGFINVLAHQHPFGIGCADSLLFDSVGPIGRVGQSQILEPRGDVRTT